MSMIPIFLRDDLRQPLGFTDPFSTSPGWIARYGKQEVVAVPLR